MKPLVIKLNKEELNYLSELEELLGIKDTYGADPKSIRIAIKTTINLIKEYRKKIEKVIPNLNESEIAILLPSIVNIEKRQEQVKKE